jgi:hypothetical protein
MQPQHSPYDVERKIEAAFLRETLPTELEFGIHQVWFDWRQKCLDLQICRENDEDWVKCKVSMKNYERILFPRLHDCQLFVTSDFQIGTVAGNCKIQIGDELWRLSGGFTPFILRQRTLETRSLISPCYFGDNMSLFGLEVKDLLLSTKLQERVTLE